MATADDITSSGYAGRARQAGSRLVGRGFLCTTSGIVEGVAAGGLTFAIALAYHLAVLHMSGTVFPYEFYAVFSALAGAGHGILAGIACGRFLDGERRPQATLLRCFYGWTAAVAVTLLTAFLAGAVGDLSRVSLTAAYVLGLPTLMGLRSALYGALAARIRRGDLQFEVLAVIGARRDVADFLAGGQLWRSGYMLGGTLEVEDVRGPDGAVSLPAVAEFVRAALKRGTDHVVIVGDPAGFREVEAIVGEIRRFALSVAYAPTTISSVLKFVDVVPIGPNNALRLTRKPLSDGDVLLKRALDIVLSGLGLLVLAPFFGLVALAIRLDSEGPAFYRQARRGFNGEPFMILKFRTMTVTESGHAMRQAVDGDPRITRVGKLLRRTSIDEFPQLWNVFRGQMSLVGPRPHAISHDDQLGERVANYAHRQRIKPGITGWAQVNGFRGETRTVEQVEGRVMHDLYYIENWSIFLDLWTLVLTVVSPAARRNAW